MKAKEQRCIHFEDHEGDELAIKIEEWLDNENGAVRIITCNYNTLLVTPWDGPDGSKWIYSALIIYECL